MSTIGNYTKGKLDHFISIRTGFTAGESTADTVDVKGVVAAMAFASSQTITSRAELPANYNGLLYGPVTIEGDGALYIGAGSVVIVRAFLDFTGSLG